jgi:hypothetical protein
MRAERRLEYFYEIGDNAVGGNEVQGVSHDDDRTESIEVSRRGQWSAGGRSTMDRILESAAPKEILPRPDLYQPLHDQRTPIVKSFVRQRVTIRVRFTVVISPRSVCLYARQCMNVDIK